VSGKSLSPLGSGCRERFRRDYGGCRGGCRIVAKGVVGSATVTGGSGVTVGLDGGGSRRRECDVVAAMEAMLVDDGAGLNGVDAVLT